MISVKNTCRTKHDLQNKLKLFISNIFKLFRKSLNPSKIFYQCTRLPGIKTTIEELLTMTMKQPAKSKHDANGSLSSLKSFVCVFMSAVWFKILSRIDIWMEVIQARQATLDTEVGWIQELVKDLAELRNSWQAVWNEVTTIAFNLGIDIKLPPGRSLDLRRNVSDERERKALKKHST